MQAWFYRLMLPPLPAKYWQLVMGPAPPIAPAALVKPGDLIKPHNLIEPRALIEPANLVKPGNAPPRPSWAGASPLERPEQLP